MFKVAEPAKFIANSLFRYGIADQLYWLVFRVMQSKIWAVRAV